MEIGDYIRYKEDGIQKIGRIEKISATLDDDVLIIEVDNGDVITSDDVLKSDKSILHEIEVGDYVNGSGVNEIKDGKPYHEDYFDPYYSYFFEEDEIHSVLTKQQFEAMQYVIKED